MSDGIVIIGSGFAARQLVKNIRKQDPNIPLTLIAADSMDEYNKPDLSHVVSRGQNADDLTLQTAGEFAEQYNLRLFPHTGQRYRRRAAPGEEPWTASGAMTNWCWPPARRRLSHRCRAAS